MEKVLITGGAGFIGRFVTDELLRRGGLYTELYRTQFERQELEPAALGD